MSDTERKDLLRRAYARLLRLYPASHHSAWGAGMLATFEQRAREVGDASRLRRGRFAAKELTNLVATVARERLGPGRARPPAGGSSPRRSLGDGDLLRDLRIAARSLASTPTFTIVAVLALTLGIGSTSAMFSVVDAILLRPLPFPDEDRIVRVWETSGDWLRNSAAAANFLDWHAESASFDRLAAYSSTSMTVTGDREPARLSGIRITGDFFGALAVTPRLGRTIEPADDVDGAPPVVVLSHALWRQRYGGDDAVLGRDVLLDGRPHTVVGVMPEGFQYPFAGTELWTAMAFDAEEAQRRSWRFLSMVGRLAEDATPDAALAELRTIAARLAAEYPAANEGVSAYLLPLREELVGAARATLLAVLGAIGFVLLIACTNVATLVLARAGARRGEVAVRAALGAGRWRIVRELATESMLLASSAGALGLLLGVWCVRFLAALVPAWLPLSVPVGLDARAVAFTLGLALSSTLLFGLLPALHATRHDLADALRSGRATSSRGQQRVRAGLVIGEVALAVVLLVAAGLMLRSFRALSAEDTGLDADGVLRLRLGLTAERYEDTTIRTGFYDALLEQARALPGAQHAAIVTAAPLAMSGGALIYTPEGQATHEQDATFRAVSDDYFAALGIALEGRDFAFADTGEAAPVIVIGRELARRAWPDQDPIGKRLKLGNENSPDPWRTVVGVADDVRQWDIELDPRPAIYVPFRQAGDTFTPRELLVRTTGDPLALAGAAREAVRAIDDDVPVTVGTMSELLAGAAAARRFNMQIFSAFALTALLLASIGLYGIVAYAVTHRTHEIGIRMALGARQRAVVTLVLRQGVLLVFAGLMLGMLGAFGAARSLESLLYEVKGLDGVTFGLVPLVLLLVGTLATLLPARRASRIAPVIALRRE